MSSVIVTSASGPRLGDNLVAVRLWSFYSREPHGRTMSAKIIALCICTRTEGKKIHVRKNLLKNIK